MSLSSESFMQEIEDRCIIDIMKENMLNERSRNEEFINFLTGQVDNYTVEISHKNKQISSLLKLLEKNNIRSWQHQMETIPQNISSDHVRKNHEECRKDVQLIRCLHRIALRCVASRLENVSDRPFVYT